MFEHGHCASPVLPRRRRTGPATPRIAMPTVTPPLNPAIAVAIAKSNFASPSPFLARAEHAAELSRAPPPPELRWPPSAVSPPFPRASNPPEALPPHTLPLTPCPEPDFAVPRPESHPQSPAAINPNPSSAPSLIDVHLPAFLRLISKHNKHLRVLFHLLDLFSL